MIRDEFQLYTDQYDLMQGWPQPGQRCGNGLRFTGEKMLSLLTRGKLLPEDIERFNTALKTCEADGPGNYLRDPTDRSSQQMDDLVSIAVASRACKTEHARWINSYGLSHFFTWKWFKFAYYYGDGHDVPLNHPGDWLGRLPSVVAIFQWSADVKPAFWRRLALAVSIACTGIKEPQAQDTWVYSWLGIKAVDQRCWMVNIAEKIFMKRFNKSWVGGWSELYARYFNDQNHPISKYPPQTKE